MSTLPLHNVHFVGYDLDHSLARYNVPALTRLCSTAFRTYLVQHNHWPESLLSSPSPPPSSSSGSSSDSHTQPRDTDTYPYARSSAGVGDKGEKSEKRDKGDKNLLSSPSSLSDSSDLHTQPCDTDTPCHARSNVIVNDKSDKGVFLSDGAFFAKGLLFDKKNGNVLRLRADGHVLGASHGRYSISPEKAAKEYKVGELKAVCAALHDEGRKVDRFFYFSTYFDMPAVAVAADMVELLDAGEHGFPQAEDDGGLPYARVMKELRDALDDAFYPLQFAPRKGHYFPEMIDHTERYVYRCTDTVKAWLRSLRSAGVYLFVLTNSFADYATHILEFILGDDWASYFDLVIFGGAKPAFFSADEPYLLVNGTEVDGDTPVTALTQHGFYTGGNLVVLENFFRSLHSDLSAEGGSAKEPRVIYFGDHLTGDVQAVAQLTSWQAVAIAEELLLHSDALEQHRTASEPPKDCAVYQADIDALNHLRPGAELWGHLLHSLHVGENEAAAETTMLYEHILRSHGALVAPHLDAIAAQAAELHLFDPQQLNRGVVHHLSYPCAPPDS